MNLVWGKWAPTEVGPQNLEIISFSSFCLAPRWGTGWEWQTGKIFTAVSLSTKKSATCTLLTVNRFQKWFSSGQLILVNRDRAGFLENRFSGHVHQKNKKNWELAIIKRYTLQANAIICFSRTSNFFASYVKQTYHFKIFFMKIKLFVP